MSGSARPSVIPKIAVYQIGNRYVISEGNHRMTAALQYFKMTGNPKYVLKFLETARKDPAPSGLKTYKMTK